MAVEASRLGRYLALAREVTVSSEPRADLLRDAMDLLWYEMDDADHEALDRANVAGVSPWQP